MTPKQILDSFSATLMQDERILSAQERALLATLLQHTKTATGESPETQQAVQKVIATAVGETVAQRAFAVLGGNIVEQILDRSAPLYDSASLFNGDVYAKTQPQPPGSQPQPPGTSPTQPLPPGSQPQPPGGHISLKTQPQPPGSQPQPPGTSPTQPLPPGSQPQPPGGHTYAVSEASVAVAERPANLPAKCVVLDEFFAPQEVEELMRFTIAHEADFRTSEVVSPMAEGGVVNYEHRRSRVLMNLHQFEDRIVQRIRTVLPHVLKKLDMGEVPITGVEAQITASNDGDFFRFHNDNGDNKVSHRYLTFVYFFHREPRQFEGGELRIHDARREEENYVSAGTYQTISPQQNQIVFFPCELMHEVRLVKCPSGSFADSRFTLNGWLLR